MTLFGPAGDVISGAPPGETLCRGCGCTDSRACVADGFVCTWVLLDIATDTGICSFCAEAADWDPHAFLLMGREAEWEGAEAEIAALMAARAAA